MLSGNILAQPLALKLIIHQSIKILTNPANCFFNLGFIMWELLKCFGPSCFLVPFGFQYEPLRNFSISCVCYILAARYVHIKQKCNCLHNACNSSSVLQDNLHRNLKPLLQCLRADKHYAVDTSDIRPIIRNCYHQISGGNSRSCHANCAPVSSILVRKIFVVSEPEI